MPLKKKYIYVYYSSHVHDRMDYLEFFHFRLRYQGANSADSVNLSVLSQNLSADVDDRLNQFLAAIR